MAVFEKTCGAFRLEVSEPWPAWVRISHGDNKMAAHIKSVELYDLRYLVDRAIAACEAREIA